MATTTRPARPTGSPRLALLVEPGADPAGVTALGRRLRTTGRPVVAIPIRGKSAAQPERFDQEGFTSYIRVEPAVLDGSAEPTERPLGRA